jgi:hypothetical protein
VTPELRQRAQTAHQQITRRLLSELGPQGYWIGELSSSALSTATAVIALATMDRGANDRWIQSGLNWLAQHANADGGWGDTVRSRSNPSTTALAWAAFGAVDADATFPQPVNGAVAYLERTLGPLAQLVPSIEALYGKDRTFSVPITMTLALSGRLGPDGWRRVRPLPFELAILPQAVFGALRLPVVSYALPALIAIGQVIHHRSKRFHPVRSLARNRTLNVLTTLQPENGGFLEATPLTSFVTMSLAGMGLAGHLVAQRGAGFLKKSMRPDGSWPIDTNLTTWVTTLSIKALRPVAAGVPPAVEGGVSPPGIPGSSSVSRSVSNRGLSMNRASVAAGVPPAVEGGVSPPGVPGSGSQRAIRESWRLPMNLPMPAIARVEQGSLTPTLSRGERVSRPALGNMPGFRPSEPSRIAPADARPSPPKPAAHRLLLPPGEGRDEGRPLHSSRHGSWSQYVSKFWKTLLSTNPASVAAGVPPAVEGGVSPPGMPVRANQDPTALSAGQDARLYGRRDAYRYNTSASPPGIPAGFRDPEKLGIEQGALDAPQRLSLRRWLLGQQYRVQHPYTGAAPGGWAWTDLPGGVPDADDTAGALLALRHLGEPDPETRQAAAAGVAWLLGLQNRDGGIPTFCRGWGTLPFDRSTPELTAHALRAWAAWEPHLEPPLANRVAQATRRALRYLDRSQRADGAWIPLWFGNEQAPLQENPVYGTAQVLIALNERKTEGLALREDSRQRAARFLVQAQRPDGAWGGDANAGVSLEETALAVEALLGLPEFQAQAEAGLTALLNLLEADPDLTAAPIGLYFARLWYFERLYPLIFAASALGRAFEATTPSDQG